MTISTMDKTADAIAVSFEDFAGEALTFTLDAMHFPAPVSPLFQSMTLATFGEALTEAAKSFNIPIDSMHVIFRENYYYDSIVPVVPNDENEARILGGLAEAAMSVELPRLMERWNNEFRPRIVSNNRRLESIEFDRAPFEQIGGLIDEVIAITRENWTMHFKIVLPMMLAMQLYDELYVDLFGGSQEDGHHLLIGMTTESVKAGFGLSELAGAARAAGLDQVILSVPAADVMERLKAEPLGEFYAAAIRDYLNEYGLRQDLFDFTTPTWRENPSIAIASIQAYIRSGHDARTQHEAAVARAAEGLGIARQSLSSYPEAIRGQFEALVTAARAANFLQEEHNFYIDQQSIALSRLAFLKFGRRLARAGILARADDIFMLTLDEVKRIAVEAATNDQVCDVRILVFEREADLDRSARRIPPPFIGQPPVGAPPSNNPMERAIVRFFGGQPQNAEAPNQLKGNPGSKGIASGVARVARTLDEAKHLQPGEVLVAITTMPAWTPLFGTAAALITETGGPLSHGAIVAREYGLPAVVGAFGATRLIQTGDRVSVNGTTGVVTLER